MDAKARQDCVKEIGLLKVSGLDQASLDWASSLGFYGSDNLGVSGQHTWSIGFVCSCPCLLPSDPILISPEPQIELPDWTWTPGWRLEEEESVGLQYYCLPFQAV